MPGHNGFDMLNAGSTSDYGGGVILIKNGVPSNTTDKGWIKGAICINTAGTNSTTTVYVNLGTVTSPTWTVLTVS